MTAEREPWSMRVAALPLFWFAFLIGTCLVIVSFPRRLNRWNAVSILIIPACGAFQTGKDLGPDDTFNDIYLRFIIILTSHITYLSFKDASPGSVSDSVSNGSGIRADFRDKGLVRKSGKNNEALISGYKLLFNARGVGTSWEVPYLWHGPKSTAELANPVDQDEKRREQKASSKPGLPSRGKWGGVGVRAGYLLLNFLLLCCYYVCGANSPAYHWGKCTNIGILTKGTF
jgi:hypothetical protein